MLIGLHGKMTAGKDTVLDRLRLISDRFERFAFADKLKVSAMASLGFRNPVPVDPYDGSANPPLTDEELIALSNSLKENGDITVAFSHAGHRILTRITGREYLQYCGTEGGRDVFGQNFWVDQAMRPALAREDENTVPTSTDTRFPNEAEAILAARGEVWEIVGPETETGHHASETRLPDEMITLKIDNTIRDDDFASLDEQLRTLVQARMEHE